MAKFLIISGVIAILILTIAVIAGSILRHQAWTHAVEGYQRRGVQADSEYDFVSRGVNARMSPSDVSKLMAGADVQTALVSNTFGGPEPYAAYYAFFHKGPCVGPLPWAYEVYIGEYYWIYFDHNQHPVRLKYQCSSVDVQTIDVDLQQMTISDHLRLPWRSSLQ